MRLEDRNAIVTGGSSGIGRGIALEFAREGANVAIGDVRREPSAGSETVPTVERVRDIGPDALFVGTEVSAPEEVEALVETTVRELGGVDIVVNNAGIAIGGSVEEISAEDWERTFAVNVGGIRNVSKYALPHLRESEAARIINMSSQLGLVARRKSAAYCGSKSAIINLTRQMALDYASESITVNALNPGIIQVRDEMSEERTERDETYTALPRIGEPQDIGRAAVFLASDDGRFVTGHSLVVDGGYTIH